MPSYYVLIQPSGVFVKEAEFFERQGGLNDAWGKKWRGPIEAASIEDARERCRDLTPSERASKWDAAAAAGSLRISVDIGRAKKVYVASSWRNERQPEVVKALLAAGHFVYDFRNPAADDHGFGWSEIDPNWKQWTAKQQVECYSHEAAVRGLKFDFDAMKWCDALVMVQPCGRSAALELGWAIGAGKKTIVLMAEGSEPELMLRLADHLCLTMDEVIEKLAEAKT
jgi:hypothetical protein